MGPPFSPLPNGLAVTGAVAPFGGRWKVEGRGERAGGLCDGLRSTLPLIADAYRLLIAFAQTRTRGRGEGERQESEVGAVHPLLIYASADQIT